jgi:protein-tyrosine phosphatase
MRRVLFVCTGNICRSPTAEGVFSKFVADAGLDGLIVVDSAGTHGYHAGEPPDPRMLVAARARGYDLERLRARQVRREDFSLFDLIIGMDRDHQAILARLAPPSGTRKIRLMMEYARRFRYDEVPDPYYGGPEGFELVIDLIEDAAEGLLESLRVELELAQR